LEVLLLFPSDDFPFPFLYASSLFFLLHCSVVWPSLPHGLYPHLIGPLEHVVCFDFVRKLDDAGIAYGPDVLYRLTLLFGVV
jgi:hypothetical protein